jgi:pimeloyl-ACP methyl ester carboxylesterase
VVLSVRILGSGTPVVLLPWFGLDQAVMAAAFEPVFAATSGWCRIYVDLPGTGQSPAVEPRSDAVLEAVLATVGPIAGARFLVAGCSYGGYLAAGLARRAPDQVAGMLMVCPGVKIRPGHRNLGHVLPSEPEPGWLRDVPTELHDHFSRGIGHQTGPVASGVTRALRLAGPADDAYLAILRSTGYQLSDEGSASRFDGNVTIFAGCADRITGYLDQFDVLASYPCGSYVALSQAGHYLPFEQSARFSSVVRDWLAQA